MVEKPKGDDQESVWVLEDYGDSREEWLAGQMEKSRVNALFSEFDHSKKSEKLNCSVQGRLVEVNKERLRLRKEIDSSLTDITVLFRPLFCLNSS